MNESLLMQCAAIMGVSMVPVLELRAAIPFGLAIVAHFKGQEQANAIKDAIFA